MKERICRVPDVTHDEWLSFRRTGIGGSDASTILGLNPYSSLYTLYNDKMGLLPAKEDTEAMRQGRDLEEYVAFRWQEATGKRCQRSNYMWRSLEHPYMIADIDREIVGENAALECKTTSVYNKSDFESGEIPLTYYAQCVHYMSVMGYDRMYLAVLVLNRGFYHYVIERDENEVKSLIKKEGDFWESYIVPKIPPPIDGSESSIDTVEKLYPSESEEIGQIMLSSKYVQILSDIGSMQETINSLKKAIEALRGGIMAEMGNAAIATAPGYRVSWKSSSRTVIDTKKLKNLYPNAYKECSKSKRSRIFRVTKTKED